MPWRRLVDRIEHASPRRLRTIVFAIVVLVLAGLITHGNYAGSGDAVHYMMIARSIAFDRDFDLGNDYADPSNILTIPAGDHARIGRNGVLRPVHDAGLPLLAAPYFGAAYRLAQLTDRLPSGIRRRAKLDRFIALRQLVSLLMIVATGALAAVFFDVSRRLTGAQPASFLWALVWALSPPILTHGYVFLTEVPSALVALLVYSRREDVRGGGSVWRAAALGALTGLLALLHVRNVGLILALAVLVVWRTRAAPRLLLSYAAGLLIPIAIKIALNLSFWGTPLTTPHEHLGAWPGMSALLSEAAIRALGLLFDARHGLLLTAPVYVLAPAAWIVLRRRSRTAADELLFVVAAYLLFVVIPVTNVHGWRGGWSPAARFLVPVAPFMACAVPLLLSVRASALIAAPLIALQLAIDAFLWGRPMLTWSEGPGTSPVLQALIGQVAGVLPPLERLDAPAMIASSIGVAVLGAASWMLSRRARMDHPA